MKNIFNKELKLNSFLCVLSLSPFVNLMMCDWGYAQHEYHEMPATQTVKEANNASDDPEEKNSHAQNTLRDPHAYANGYRLGEGEYTLGSGRQLHLADEHDFWAVNVYRMEYAKDGDSNSALVDLQAWYGKSYDKFVVKLEAEFTENELADMQSDLLWSHAITPFWDSQLGVRIDSGGGPNRTWLAAGVQGLAPYWFEIDATFYLGQSGRTALQLEADYELMLTQRVVLQPRVELNMYGKDDVAKGIGSGLADISAGLRLRYEFSRQFAPYIGVDWTSKFGNTADIAEINQEDTSHTQWLVGIRGWF